MKNTQHRARMNYSWERNVKLMFKETSEDHIHCKGKININSLVSYVVQKVKAAAVQNGVKYMVTGEHRYTTVNKHK